ncbi:MAG: hypothetical protein R6W66_05515 [Pelovirga sp.]
MVEQPPRREPAEHAAVTPAQILLAVDVGLHTGLALFDDAARLLWYRSHHLADPQKLKRLVAKLLRSPPRPTHIYLEGGGPLADIWLRAADSSGLTPVQLQAQQWRQRLFHARQHSSGSIAKQQADRMARDVIAALGDKNPTGLRHDTAEAVLLGLYALLDLGWLDSWPPTKEKK